MEEVQLKTKHFIIQDDKLYPYKLPTCYPIANALSDMFNTEEIYAGIIFSSVGNKELEHEYYNYNDYTNDCSMALSSNNPEEVIRTIKIINIYDRTTA